MATLEERAGMTNWRKTRGHVGKIAHKTRVSAKTHAYLLRKKTGAVVHVYRCGEGRARLTDPKHWHVGHN